MGDPRIAVLVWGKGEVWGDWRDLYLFDTGAGTFTHINEIWADGPDRPPAIALQGGTCRASPAAPAR